MSNLSESILLVDGSSYLYRSFFAMPALTNPKGEPIGAIYGCIKMILSVINNLESKYCSIVFDGPKKTFRHELYKEYKATRESAPNDLVFQIQPIKDILVSLGLKVITSDGVEADDTIGSIATSMQSLYQKDIIIATSDKDISQLINEHISILDTKKDKIIFQSINETTEKFGVGPKYIADYLALCGDSSDNIPGVKGIGPKAASALISKYGSIESIYQNIEDILESDIRAKKSIYNNLNLYKEDCFISKQLTIIKTDIEYDFNLKSYLIKEVNLENLSKLSNEFGLNKLLYSYLKDYKDNSEETQKIDYTYKIINSNKIDSLKHILDKISSQNIYFQIQNNIYTINIVSKTHNIVIDLSECESNIEKEIEIILDYLLEVKAKNKLSFATYNLKELFHKTSLAKKISDIIDFDILLGAYIIESNSIFNLEFLSQKYLQLDLEFNEEAHDKYLNFSKESIHCLKLTEVLKARLKNNPELANILYNIEIPLSYILYNMEKNGVYIDTKELNEQSKYLESELKKIEEEIHLIAGEEFNISSPKQLSDILFTKLLIKPIKKTKTGAYSTNEEVLEELAKEHEIASLLLNYRSLFKLKTTYTDKLPLLIDCKGRVHTTYNQTGTITGRLSSNNPNLQNIPIKTELGSKIRGAFKAQNNNVIISADYSQIELRVMAHLSQDKNMMKAFNNNIDIHTLTASEVLEKNISKVSKDERRSAKAINFGLIYGMGSLGLSKALQISQDEAKKYMNTYFEKYKGVGEYMAKTSKEASKNGFVNTILGRKILLPKINSRNMSEVRASLRVAINAPVQGSAADIIKLAMLHTFNKIKNKDDIKLLLQVHDELIFEVHKDKKEEYLKLVKDIMENAFMLLIPLIAEADSGESWKEAH